MQVSVTFNSMPLHFRAGGGSVQKQDNLRRGDRLMHASNAWKFEIQHSRPGCPPPPPNVHLAS